MNVAVTIALIWCAGAAVLVTLGTGKAHGLLLVAGIAFAVIVAATGANIISEAVNNYTLALQQAQL